MFTGVQRPVLKFSEICTFSVLYKAYLAARRGKRSRAATANYEVHLLANIVNLVYILQTKIYRPGLFRVFYVYEPKKRLVQAPAFVDKVVQHALVDNLIYERITNSFILDNYASQKGKGLHFGLDRLRGFFTEYWNKYRTAEGWVLKCDVRKFFASIDHDRLKEKLKKLDPDGYTYYERRLKGELGRRYERLYLALRRLANHIPDFYYTDYSGWRRLSDSINTPPLWIEAEDPAHHRHLTFEHRGVILRTTITDCDTNIAQSSLYRRREDMASDLLALYQDELPVYMPWSEERRRKSDARHDLSLTQTFKETSEVRQKAAKKKSRKRSTKS